MKLEILAHKDNQAIQNEIISKIQDLINYKNLEPGDRLPPERAMADKFGVSRRNLSKAIQKLEFYGLLESKPQSGTFIADIGRLAMNGIMDNIQELGEPDFKSLIETRIGLETVIVQYAARRRSDSDLEKIKAALDAFRIKLLDGQEYLEEDILFHLEIAKASTYGDDHPHSLIIPGLIRTYDQGKICTGEEALSEVKRHEDIYLAIKSSDAKLAKETMDIHFARLQEYLLNLD